MRVCKTLRKQTLLGLLEGDAKWEIITLERLNRNSRQNFKNVF